MKQKIIAVVGLAGTGKTEVVNIIMKSKQFHKVYFGGLVLAEVERRGLAVNPTHESQVRTDLRKEHGMAAMAILSLPAIDAALALGEDVLIDGLYSYSEYILLKERYASALTLIAIHAPRHLRVERLGSRPVRPLTEAEIDARDHHEIITMEKAPPIVLADFHIINDGSLQELISRIENTLPQQTLTE